MRRLLYAVLLIPPVLLATACKTSHGGNTESQSLSEEGVLPLGDFGYQLNPAFLNAAAARLGCAEASKWILQPQDGDLPSVLNELAAAPFPYSVIANHLRSNATAQSACVKHASPNQNRLSGFRALYDKVRKQNFGLTFVMVGGFGTHINPLAAVGGAMQAWQDEILAALPAGEQNYLRVVRQECLPNSFASDELCAPRLLERFQTLEDEAKAKGVVHRYVFWGYSKGGNTIVEALGRSPAMRNQTLFAVTAGAPLGGSAAVLPMLPILRTAVESGAGISDGEAAGIGRILSAFGMTAGSDDSSQVLKKFPPLLTQTELANTLAGAQSMSPAVRQQYFKETFANMDFSRSQDPVTHATKIPIYFIAGGVDPVLLDAFPVWTLDANGLPLPRMDSMQLFHFGEMILTPYLATHPITDMITGLESAVIPQSALAGKNIRANLLGIVNMDHTYISFYAPSPPSAAAGPFASPLVRYPHVELVDAAFAAILQDMQ